MAVAKQGCGGFKLGVELRVGGAVTAVWCAAGIGFMVVVAVQWAPLTWDNSFCTYCTVVPSQSHKCRATSIKHSIIYTETCIK